EIGKLLFRLEFRERRDLVAPGSRICWSSPYRARSRPLWPRYSFAASQKAGFPNRKGVSVKIVPPAIAMLSLRGSSETYAIGSSVFTWTRSINSTSSTDFASCARSRLFNGAEMKFPAMKKIDDRNDERKMA